MCIIPAADRAGISSLVLKHCSISLVPWAACGYRGPHHQASSFLSFLSSRYGNMQGHVQHQSSSRASYVCSAKKQWLVQRMEDQQQATKQQQLGILRGLVDADAFERFLASKFPASKVTLPATWATNLPRNEVCYIYAAHSQDKNTALHSSSVGKWHGQCCAHARDRMHLSLQLLQHIIPHACRYMSAAMLKCS